MFCIGELIASKEGKVGYIIEVKGSCKASHLENQLLINKGHLGFSAFRGAPALKNALTSWAFFFLRSFFVS